MLLTYLFYSTVLLLCFQFLFKNFIDYILIVSCCKYFWKSVQNGIKNIFYFPDDKRKTSLTSWLFCSFFLHLITYKIKHIFIRKKYIVIFIKHDQTFRQKSKPIRKYTYHMKKNKIVALHFFFHYKTWGQHTHTHL